MLKVGAATEVEMKEKKARVDDAVHALRAAVEEGVVPGGGVALVRAMKAVQSLRLPEERKAGAEIVARAMGEPLRQIARNAGHEPEVVFNAVLEGKDDYGFNAATEDYEELDKTGVIDPAKVVRTALENAVSAASLLLTTEAAVAEKPQKAGADGRDASVAVEWVAWEEWVVWEAWVEWTTTATTSRGELAGGTGKTAISREPRANDSNSLFACPQ